MGDTGAHEKRRSERIRLSVPVTVVTETREREQIQEEARTVSVNAHGGLFKLRMEVLMGQPLILINTTTDMQESCRVVRAEELPNGEFAVAFEFDEPSPGFWPVTFPPADWKLSVSESQREHMLRNPHD
jgi:hypothetical protein